MQQYKTTIILTLCFLATNAPIILLEIRPLCFYILTLFLILYLLAQLIYKVQAIVHATHGESLLLYPIFFLRFFIAGGTQASFVPMKLWLNQAFEEIS